MRIERITLYRTLRPLLAAVVTIATGVTILVLALRMLGVFVLPELAIYDHLIKARSVARTSPSQVVLVGFNEEDVRRLGWPLSDEVLTKTLQAILSHQPRAVGVDVYRDMPIPPGAEDLSELLSRRDQVIGVMKVGDSRATSIAPHKALRQNNRAGFSDVVVDAGGVVRRGLLFMEESGRNYQAFSLLLALKYLAANDIRPAADPESGAMRLGTATVAPVEDNAGGYVNADAGGYQFLLDYRHGPSPFPLLTVSDVLDASIDPAAFRDKVVIVGTAAESVKDFFYTPFNEDRGGKRIVQGIAVHGHIVDQLLRMAAGTTPVMKVSSEGLEIVAIAVAALLGVICAVFLRSPRFLMPVGAFGLVLLGFITWFSFNRFMWVPLVPHSTAWVVSIVVMAGYISWREYQERGDLMSLFSRHLSPEIANMIWTGRKDFLDASGQPRSQRVPATILFSDIKGFTTVAEKLGPREQMDWLNRYMSAMIEVVRKHGGTVNQLIGDCVMAVFGVPIARTTDSEIQQDAVNAVDCALAMRDSLKLVNADNKRLELPQISIRVGIYTGPVVTGPVGDKNRAQFAVVGDTVNTAARLESLPADDAASAVTDNCRILIGEKTLVHLADRYKTLPLGNKELKGKDQVLPVFKVEGLAEGRDGTGTGSG